MISKSFKLRKAKKKDERKIISFIKAFFFKKHHILTRNSKLFKWQYSNNSISCSLAILKKKIIGLQFYIPLSQFDNNLKQKKEIFNSLWFTKKSNIIALGEKIFDFTFKSAKPNLVIAMGIPNYLIYFHSKKSFVIKKMSHYFIINPSKKNNLLKIKPKKFNDQKKIEFKKIENLKSLKNFMNEAIFKNQYPLKSNKYLEKRYLKHPVYKYYIYGIKFKKQKCVCIYRIVKNKKINIIRLVDFVGLNKSFSFLNNFLLFIMNKHSSDYADLYSYGIPSKDLNNAGFSNKDDYKGLIIPNHYEPFENKNIEIMIGYKSKYKNNSKIRLFKGDSDIDRPNL